MGKDCNCIIYQKCKNGVWKAVLSMVIILFGTIMTTICPVSAQSYNIIGSVLTTDIKAYINGYEIPAYNVDGNMVIVGSDLRNYGFEVVYDNAARTSTVSFTEEGGQWSPMYVTHQKPTAIGGKVMDVYDTDISVIVNGKQVPSYNVDGKMAFKFSELKVYGEYNYNNSNRTTNLWINFDNVPKNDDPIIASGNAAELSGSWYTTDLEWTLTQSGVLEFHGNGSMASYHVKSNVNEDDRPWASYADMIKKVIINEGCKDIGINAFSDMDSITQVIIAESVSRIGVNAFSCCDSLIEVDMPSKMTFIGDSAFYGTKIKSIVIPEGVTSLGLIIFGHCRDLEEVYLPSTLEKSNCSFTSCSSLKSLYIPAALQIIASDFSKGTPLEKVYFYGSPPKGFSVISFPSTATLYYIEGTPGWTSPTWTAPDGTVYKTATFKP